MDSCLAEDFRIELYFYYLCAISIDLCTLFIVDCLIKSMVKSTIEKSGIFFFFKASPILLNSAIGNRIIYG